VAVTSADPDNFLLATARELHLAAAPDSGVEQRLQRLNLILMRLSAEDLAAVTSISPESAWSVWRCHAHATAWRSGAQLSFDFAWTRRLDSAEQAEEAAEEGVRYATEAWHALDILYRQAAAQPRDKPAASDGPTVEAPAAFGSARYELHELFDRLEQVHDWLQGHGGGEALHGAARSAAILVGALDELEDTAWQWPLVGLSWLWYRFLVRSVAWREAATAALDHVDRRRRHDPGDAEAALRSGVAFAAEAASELLKLHQLLASVR
jgi:hypothetical protein